MSPKECASLLVLLAERDPIYERPNAVDEVVYLLAWYLWDMLDEDAPEWTEALGRELDRLRDGITSEGCHERFAAYGEAKADNTGGGPSSHITSVFQTYVLGSAPMDVTEAMDVFVRLAAMMHGIGEAVLGDLK